MKAVSIAASLLIASIAATSASAQETAVLPATILYSTSTGYWQDDPAGPAEAPPDAQSPAPSPAAGPVQKQAPRHGYYKLFAVRQADRTSKVYLQQIVASEDAPQVLSTTELPEITALKAYVTDIRPENSGGIIREPGLFAMVFIKTDPDADAEVWNVMLDELGEVTVEKASN
ncbi:hypothetical protein CPY51_00595 [Rhizobium tubonense]|uniref:Uncharacterized protein n=1 Tax=Rhizobium tubonense TaxID=484088 RepID=A0A2W4D3C2_9HYPH|nr:hypothetical protein CPY51_00595 [Rhizobium tubonense]